VLKKLTLFFFSILLYSFGTAQNITPQGVFLNDSIQIGEPLPFVLSIKYPKELEVVFPDSLYDFSPFELSRKVYFPTKSDSIISTDSAIYYLTTFEIDTVQSLKLPVFQINDFDSAILWTTIDSVVLKQVVIAIPDSVAMITNTTYIEVPMAFNYPYASIGLIVSIILVLAIWFIFGKTIKNKIKVYYLKKRNATFLTSFEQLIEDDYLNTEAILTLWKSYLEKLKKAPYTKLTTKEIGEIFEDKKIVIALMDIDKNIYGPKDESLLENAYSIIKENAVNEFNHEVTQIING